MVDSHPLIALISAVTAAIPPARLAFDEEFPEARVWNVLDDRLLDDAAEHGAVSTHLATRMHRLIEHTLIEGAHAVLLTCSMYAPVAHRAAATAGVPVLGPDDAVFEAVAGAGYRHLAVVSSATDPLADSLTRIRRVVGPDVRLTGVITGDPNSAPAEITRMVDESPLAPDAVVLGQYSLAPAAAAIRAATGLPTLAGPPFAARMLRTLTVGEPA